MIREIINFIDYLDKNSQEIFTEGLELKQGLYCFVDKKDDEYVINDTLLVDKNTEKDDLYTRFLELKTNTEMLNAMKSFNSGPKIFIDIGSPFAISISGKGLTKDRTKLLQGAEAYFKAAKKYIDDSENQYSDWMKEFSGFVLSEKIFDFINEQDFIEIEKIKVSDMFYFFYRKPELKDYRKIHERFLKEKLFNKDKFNITIDKDVYGISDALSGFNDKKEFLQHKTAPFQYNFRVNGTDVAKVFIFFRLQQKNKILPNPFPLFVDEQELSEHAIKFYKQDKRVGHKEIIEELLKNKKSDLQNYYLIYFHNGLKGSRILDLDFVPVFRYDTDDLPKIKALFKMTSKKDGELIRDFKINNIFHFQDVILNKLFNGQLLQNTKNGLWIKYFDDLDVKPEFGATETIVNLFYKYRKSFYDFVYKSKRQAISFPVFYEICRKSIVDGIKRDKDFNKTFNIKEKLNIWFSLYNYFNNDKNNEDMVNKTKELFERIKEIAKVENDLHIETDDEFAFAAGQLIRTILNKSETGERTHALLEPFLQKTDAEQFKLAIAREFDKYKHAFKFYKGDKNRYEFDKIMSEVMGAETTVNMKSLLPMILAGYFSETIFKKEENNNNNQ